MDQVTLNKMFDPGAKDVILKNVGYWNDDTKKYDRELAQFQAIKLMKSVGSYFEPVKFHIITPQNLVWAEAIFASWLSDRFGLNARLQYEKNSIVPYDVYIETEHIYKGLKDKETGIMSAIEIAVDILARQNQNVMCSYFIANGTIPKFEDLIITSWSGYLATGPFTSDKSIYTNILRITPTMGSIFNKIKIDAFLDQYAR